MSNRLYLDRPGFEPVFFAVVPDSFMKRDGGVHAALALSAERAGWVPEDECPLVRPFDRWAF